MNFESLSADQIYDAMQRRDASLDGIVFVGVKTTGIYCRPVCTARLPNRPNVTFHPSAAAAEARGFRPCLRCRPETAPFCPAWKGTRSTVDRALSLIESGALDQNNVEHLSDRLGVGQRHLTRLFAKHVGASPMQVARTLRVQRAKRLLDDDALTIAEIADLSGFPSPRRMRAAFNALYGRAPTEFRKGHNSLGDLPCPRSKPNSCSRRA